MPRVYSYIVRYDIGFAPNPYFGVCTLATCKPKIRKKAEVGDWVVGFGSVENKRSGQLVFGMQVDETLTYDEYWKDPRFQAKKPNRSGSVRQQYGDNVYHSVDGTSDWVQEDGRHSWDDGSTNLGHLERDTSAPRVLLSKRFAYYGRDSIPVPADLRNIDGFDVCKVGRAHQVNRPAGVDKTLIDWISGCCGDGLVGEPADWTKPLRHLRR